MLGEGGEAVAVREEVGAREGGGVDGEAAAPQAQLVLTASWLTMKEAALLAGTLARGLPPGGARPPARLAPAAVTVASCHLRCLMIRFHQQAAPVPPICMAAPLDACSRLILRHQTDIEYRQTPHTRAHTKLWTVPHMCFCVTCA